MEGITIAEAARKAGVHPNTLRRWARRGWLMVSRNYLGHRIFTGKQIEEIQRRIEGLSDQEETPR